MIYQAMIIDDQGIKTKTTSL